MKRPLKIKLTRAQIVAGIAAFALTALAVLMVVLGRIYAVRPVLLTGLLTLLPALTQLVLLLPVIRMPDQPEPVPSKLKTKLRTLFYRCAAWYHKYRAGVVTVLIAAVLLGANVIFWRKLPVGNIPANWLLPVVLAVVFLVCVVMERLCIHAENPEESAQTARLKGLRSAFFLLRIAVLLTVAGEVLKLIGLFDATGIVTVLLFVLMVYATVVLAFCTSVRLIRKELDTCPELPVNLIGMGADMNILTYLEQNTGITMRSLWSLRLMKKVLPGAVLAVALLIWLSTCFVQIDAQQHGALFRLGKLHPKALEPGFHMTLPWPFDRVDIYDTNSVRRVTIGYVATGDQDNIWTEDHGGEEYLLLLGDGNEMVSINLQIEFKIANLLDYISSSASPESMLQAQAYEIVTARTIATDLDSLLAADREAFSETFRQELTERIAPYGTGLEIVNVVLESIHPPVDIADVYQDIISAGIDAEYILLNAEADANSTVMNAKKQNTQTVSNALSQKYTDIANAQASVTEFMAAAAADDAYRQEYRFHKYLEALTKTYSGSTMILCGEGIDTSRLVISGFKDEEVTEPTVPEEEYEEEYFEEDYYEEDYYNEIPE